MILGIFDRRSAGRVAVRPPELEEHWACHKPCDRVLLGTGTEFRSPTYLAPPPGGDPSGRIAVALCGRIGAGWTPSTPDGDETGDGPLAHVADLYRKHGADFPSHMEGKFAVAIWDEQEGRLLLARDRFGIEPLFYAEEADGFRFGSTTMVLRKLMSRSAGLNLEALSKVLTFDYNPGYSSVLEGIRKLPPARVLIVDGNGTSEHRYWRLTFPSPTERSEQEIVGELRELLQEAVARRMRHDPSSAGVFLSGGMDSSTVLGYGSRLSKGRVDAYSYRCRGQSFDESHYARVMADRSGARHHLIDYTPESVELAGDFVRQMSEPFCELGINVASYLVGRDAAPISDYVLTGDGGDELFGGHPVYEADKVARFVDPIPYLLKAPGLALARKLPDTDRKKDLFVKLKRFAESLRLPRDLGTHRWRVYYTPGELGSLLQPDVAAELNGHDVFEDILAINAEADGPDLLSRSLYSDYFTQVDFYLRRNDLNRGFGLETRYPLLDRELVEYCARLPSSLKVKGWFDPKYILHKAMDGVLPDEIVHREDKLGHSIPLKNWLRDEPTVRDFVLDYLNPDAVKARGLFRPEAIEGMLEDHMSRRRNNSHRLWALTILEIWLREHVDGSRR